MSREIMIAAATMLLTSVCSSTSYSQVPDVVSTTPSANAQNVTATSSISVTFSVPLDEATINSESFVVRARATGFTQGEISYDGPTRTSTFDPQVPFTAGDLVTVVLTEEIESQTGESLTGGYSWSFTIETRRGTGSFDSLTNYTTGRFPYSVCAADLTGDRYLDLVTANIYQGDATVFFNDGSGGFAEDSTYSLSGSKPYSVCAFDLDNDNDIDLVFAEYDLDSVTILLNGGNGTFTAGSSYSVAGAPTAVHSADLDSDGDLDLIAANFSDASISVLLNLGGAAFAAADTYPTGTEPRYIATGDFDLDGHVDVATSSVANGVFVLLNDGDGSLGSYGGYGTAASPLGVTTADLNQDGLLDLATSNTISGVISVLIGSGDGSLGFPTNWEQCLDPGFIYSADIDCDGMLDVVLACANDGQVCVKPNEGNAEFNSTDCSSVDGRVCRSVAAADLDNDGDVDLAVCSYDYPEVGDYLSVFLNQNAPAVCGDGDGNGMVNISDGVYLIAYIFGGGPAPDPLISGDVDCNEIVNISDAVYLIAYIFGGGPAPCAACP